MKIVLLKGLPASGKSTYARELVDKHPGQYKRVNKDDLRTMLDNNRWSKHNEKLVISVRDSIIIQALKDGHSVVVDDTNFDPKHESRMREIAEQFNADVEVKFFDIPLDECIRRDKIRQNPCGEEVIVRMYNRYIGGTRTTYPPPTYDPNLPDAIMCDLDGTLAILNGRNPYDASTCEDDQLNKAVADILTHFSLSNKILLVSGRMDKFREPTERWLKKHKIPYDRLIMRQTDDVRKDSLIKKEIFDSEIKGKYNVEFVMDDRLQVCRMWYKEGLTLLRVGDPDAGF